jgi:hypothetical protein
MPVYSLGKIAIVLPTTAEIARLQPTASDLQAQSEADARHLLVMGFPADLCLGYINTVSWRGRPQPVETLHSPADLLSWIHRSEVVNNALLKKCGGGSAIMKQKQQCGLPVPLRFARRCFAFQHCCRQHARGSGRHRDV